MDYQTILLPTDGSQCAGAAIDRAIALADRYDASLHALYVVDQGIGTLSEWDFVVERQEEEGETALDEVGRRAAAADVPLEKHLRRGVPEDQILDFVGDHDVDLVVMGTCGHQGLERLQHAGSTTERVIRASPVPVLVVPPP
ncbi:MAG: universal stress protein, partial [Halodesulfurarchaeum sp.]